MSLANIANTRFSLSTKKMRSKGLNSGGHIKLKPPSSVSRRLASRVRLGGGGRRITKPCQLPTGEHTPLDLIVLCEENFPTNMRIKRLRGTGVNAFWFVCFPKTLASWYKLKVWIEIQNAVLQYLLIMSPPHVLPFLPATKREILG